MLRRKAVICYHSWRCCNAPRYQNPTQWDLETIEHRLREAGITVHDFIPSPEQFTRFKTEDWFPSDYHDGPSGGVWDEKLLEHWIAFQLLGLGGYGPNDVYVDVAAANSPWAMMLRKRMGIQAFAIDLGPIGEAYLNLPYYRTENAVRSSFANATVSGLSLHCAFEMFVGDDDVRLVSELARILKPGGKAVIVPLYLHTQYCAYSTPEYYGKGHTDRGAREYVRTDCLGVPSSRKYDARALQVRVIEPVWQAGLRFRLLALRNKRELGQNIYCHFILEIEK